MSNIVQKFTPEKNNQQITITDAAIKHIQKEIQKQGSGIGIRFGVKKTGCSGLAYVIEIIHEYNNNDEIFPAQNDLVVVVDPKDLPFLQGTRIDYVRDGLNYRFQYNNPNETASCGCGESFTV